MRVFTGLAVLVGTANAEVEDWKSARKRPVAPGQDRHSIHAYFNTSPESPDGKRVLYFTSDTPEGEHGDLRVLDRASGRETIVARDVTTEDAHRAACQQWAGGGRYVVYHNLREGRWSVHAVDVETGEDRILAHDRQVGFGSPQGKWAPVYGCHWSPGPHRDLELIDVFTGETTVAVTAQQTLAEYGDWIETKLGSRDLTIFFPIVSPDESKVFFKPCIPGGGESFRGMNVSRRDGKVVYDLTNRRFLRLVETWGHPSWSPDSTGIFEKRNALMDVASGKDLPRYSPSCFSDHPTLSPDGSVFVTDADVSRRPFGQPNYWAIGVGSTQRDEFVVVDLFDNSQGAKSWRHNHPHPAFSADGKRIYYNVNDGPWTRLMVAEIE
jgi:Tol biopolymer transport system component